jgi:hypothetical protein
MVNPAYLRTCSPDSNLEFLTRELPCQLVAFVLFEVCFSASSLFQTELKLKHMKS